MLRQCADSLDQFDGFGWIACRGNRGRAKSRKLVSSLLRRCDSFVEDLQTLCSVLGRCLAARQDAGRSADAGQRIANLVSEAGRELAGRREPFRLLHVVDVLLQLDIHLLQLCLGGFHSLPLHAFAVGKQAGDDTAAPKVLSSTTWSWASTGSGTNDGRWMAFAAP